MATFLNPYLHFEGVARDAITFYAAVFGGEPSVMTYGEMGMEVVFLPPPGRALAGNRAETSIPAV